jgi:NitT/TauT family transport system substrate-binding protein
VPLAGFTTYSEFTAADVDAFQKFFNVFTERKIFTRAVPVKPLLYTA